VRLFYSHQAESGKKFVTLRNSRNVTQSSHQRLVGDDSGVRATDFSLDSSEEMKSLCCGPLEETGKSVPQRGGERSFPGVGEAVAYSDSARGHAHLGDDFQQPPR
jgi:hypothetical protein